MTYNLAIFCGSSSPKNETLKKEIKSLIDFLSEVNGVNLVYGGENWCYGRSCGDLP